MLELPSDIVLQCGLGLLVLFSMQILLALYVILNLRHESRERASHYHELYGLLKKIEGLTSNRREQMLKHDDKILERVTTRLPPTIAAQAGQTIYETESMILTRLAELEPSLKVNPEGRRKMEQLIRSMESLEDTIVSLTADTVRNVMTESRRELLNEAEFIDKNLAA
jgi:hypothetical protein